MTQSAIEKELLAVTKLKDKKGEERDAYLKRLMLAVTKITDDDWATLSSEAQEWTNNGASANKKREAIADFPDLPEAPEDEEADETAEQAEGEDEAEEESALEKAAEKPLRAGRKVSACHMIKQIVCRKPSSSVDEISQKIKAKGMKVSDVTIATMRSDTRDTLRVLNDLNIGKFKL